MSQNIFFGLNSFSKNQIYNSEQKPIQMGSLRGMGSTTRKYTWCRRNTSNPELCINEFVKIQNEVSSNDNNNNEVSKAEDAIYVGGIYGTNVSNQTCNLDIYSSDGSKSYTLPAKLGIYNGNNYLSYLMKYDKDGSYKWAVKMGLSGARGTLVNNTMVRQNLIADKKNGYIYVVGLQDLKTAPMGDPPARTIYFNSTDNIQYSLLLNINANIANQNVCYFAKYDSNGKFIWATYVINPYVLDSSLYFIRSSIVALDKMQNPIYSFLLSGRAQIYETQNNNRVLEINSNAGIEFANFYDNIIVKYNSNGKYLWYTKIGNLFTTSNFNATSYQTSVSCDLNNNVIVSGYWGLTNVDPLKIYDVNNLDTPILTFTKSGDTDVYLIKYSSLGILQWATKIGGNSFEGVTIISTDSFNNIYVLLNYTSTPLNIYNKNDYINPALIIEKNTPTTNKGFCLIKYNSDGFVQWASNIYANTGSTSYLNTLSMSINSNNEIILSSVTNVLSILNIYNSQSTTPNGQIIFKNDGLGFQNTFIIKINSSGNYVWGSYLGFGIISEGVISQSLSIDTSNNIIITGINRSDYVYAYSSTNYNTPTLTLPFKKLSPSVRSDSNTFIIKYNDSGVPIWAAQNTANSDFSAVSCG